MLSSNPILNKSLQGIRISESEAIDLFYNASSLDLAFVANEVRKRFHPDTEAVTYVIQRNINYTNVCTANCSFCAFYTKPSETNAYVLDYETQIKIKIQELVAINGTEILLQGGHNPELGLDYYKNLFAQIKKDFPQITLHALSPAEIIHIAEKEFSPNYGDGKDRSKILQPRIDQISHILSSLQKSGMDSLPGAGAEILTEKVRKIIAPLKIKSQTWLDVMEVAHRLGLRSSATMMYGHVESYEDRVEHLRVLRELQDKTQGFTAFIAWNFQQGQTPLSKIMQALNQQGKLFKYNLNSSGDEYLRTMSIARIYLDNFVNFQSSWVTQGQQIGQLALAFACNDFGGNMMEENVVSAAGTTHRADIEEMIYLIESTGHKALQRNTQYQLI